MPYQWHILPFGLSPAPRVYIHHQTHLFLCCCKDLHIVIYLEHILALIWSKRAGRRARLFCVPCWPVLVYTSFFQVRLLPFSVLTFLQLCWDTVHMSVSLPPDKLAEFQQLALLLLQTPCVTVHRVMPFSWVRPNFYHWPFPFATLMLCHSEWYPRCLPFSYTIIFMCSFFSFLFLSTGTVGYITPKSSPLQFPLPDVVIASDATPLIGPFIFRDMGYLLS